MKDKTLPEEFMKASTMYLTVLGSTILLIKILALLYICLYTI